MIIVVYASSRIKGQCICVASSPYNYMDISNFPTSYFRPCRRDKWNVICVVYDTTSGKSSLWVNHGKIRDFACHLPLKASTLNLINRVAHFDGARVYSNWSDCCTNDLPRKELMVALYEQIQKRCRVSH